MKFQSDDQGKGESTITLPHEPLPFSDKKQSALFGYILANEQLFLQTVNIIKPEWFNDPWTGKAVGALYKFYRRWGRIPTFDELKESSEDFQSEDQGGRIKMEAAANKARIATKDFGLDVLSAELTGWLRSVIYKNSVEASAKAYNKKDFDGAYATLKRAWEDIESSSFETQAAVNWSDFPALFNAQREELANALTWGLAKMDKLIHPGCSSGSLLRGDTTIVLAPTNAGKTTCMATVSIANLRLNKRVLFLSHEGRPEDIQHKLWCGALNCSQETLLAMYEDEHKRKQLDRMAKILKERLVYIPLNKAGMTVQEVGSLIRREQDRFASKNGGHGFDLLVDDYPAKLGCDEGARGNLARRDKDETVYNYFVQLALEYKFHALLAIQTNREGSKINQGRKGHEERLLGPEDVLESWGPMTVATNVISINRDPVAEAQNRLTYYIAKSRSSEKGWAVVCRTNYAHATTHSNDLGCAWYRNQATLANKVDGLLDQYRDQQLPASEWFNE